MSDKSERLFEAMSELSDKTIDEGATYNPKKKFRWKRWTALAACLAILVVGVGGITGLIPIFHIGANAGGSGHDEASVFMSYAGPVFPLTLGEANNSITAQRDITLDFAPWVPRWESNEERLSDRTWPTEEERQAVLKDYQELYPEGGQYRYNSHILVTDAYTLTNSSEENQTITLLYPFASSLSELGWSRPTLTMDGQELETRTHVGTYSGSFEGVWSGTLMEGEEGGSSNLNYAESWEDYKALLGDGSYLQNALGPAPDVSSVPVVVYEFTDPYGPAQDEEAGIPNPFLRVGFDLDYDKTTVLAYGFHGGRYDRENGTMIQGFSIPQEGESRYGQTFYLLVVGEDVENMTIGGYVTGGTDPDTQELEGCGVTVERYESDLDTMLRKILTPMWEEESQKTYEQDGTELSVDFDTWYRAFLEHLFAYGVLSPEAAERYGTGWLEELGSDVNTVDRVCWLEAEVTVPAGGSVAVSAQMNKENSYDFYCAHTENSGVSSYDLVTTLGSNLSCTEQTATLEDRGQIVIVRQNFGFDLENGVKTVTLDPGTEHYYLEVKRLAGTIPEEPPES